MTLNRRWRCGWLLAGVLSVAPALAVNLGFLNDAPYTHFTEADRKLFDDTLIDVLSHGADGQAREWSNPATRAGGEIKPLKSFDRAGASCRTVSIRNAAKGRSETGQYSFCKDDSGAWKLAQ